MQRSDVSACIIARNEAGNIREAIDSVWRIAGQVIVVDTGSEDNTPDLAKRAGAEVHHLPWCDDFSAPRNEGLRHAKGKWVIWFDCDDRIERAEQDKILRLPADNIRCAYHLRVVNVGQSGGVDTECHQLRIFPRLPGTRWEGRIHEQVVYSLTRAGCSVIVTDATILHSGYHDDDGHRAKFARNLRLLRLQVLENPDDPYLWYHLMHSLNACGDTAGAIRAALWLVSKTAHHRINPDLVTNAHIMLSQIYRKMGQLQESRRWLLLGLDLDPDHGPFHFLLGEDALQGGAKELARWHLTRFLECAQIEALALPLDEMRKTALAWVKEILRRQKE